MLSINSVINKQIQIFNIIIGRWSSPRGVVDNALNCDSVVSEFKLQSLYYIHNRTNTLWKAWTPYSPVMR